MNLSLELVVYSGRESDRPHRRATGLYLYPVLVFAAALARFFR